MCIILLLKCIYRSDVFDIKSVNNMASILHALLASRRRINILSSLSSVLIKRVQLDDDRIQNSCFLSNV